MFVLFVHESNAINDGRRRRYEAVRTRTEFYGSSVMIRNRVCAEEEGESRRSRDQEEELRAKSVLNDDDERDCGDRLRREMDSGILVRTCR